MDFERTARHTSASPPSPKNTTGPASWKWTACRLRDINRNTLRKPRKEPGIPRHHLPEGPEQDQNPAHLRRLIVDLIGKEPWSALTRRRQGRYLRRPPRKERQDTKSGAGPVLHASRLIDAIVEVMRPQPGTRHHRSRRRHRRFSSFGRQPHPQDDKLDRDQVHLQLKRSKRRSALRVELLASTARLCRHEPAPPRPRAMRRISPRARTASPPSQRSTTKWCFTNPHSARSPASRLSTRMATR